MEVQMDYVKLFNELVRIAKLTNPESGFASNIDDELQKLGVDSLDIVLVFTFLSEVYGLNEENSKSIPTTSLREIFEFVEQHKTKSPNSLEEAVESVR
jgi:acyl carrier protein